MGTGGFTHEARAHSSAQDEWYTPPWVFDELGATFAVDPCSPGAAVTPWIPAERVLTKADDGLTADWGRGTAWVNPPYSVTGDWVERVLSRYELLGGLNGSGGAITLTFSRTDNAWAQRLLRQATAVLFLRRRVQFLDPRGEQPGSPGAGSMLCAFGREEAEALRRMARDGKRGVIR